MATSKMTHRKMRDGGYDGRSIFLQGTQKSAYSMAANDILQEAVRLYSVSDSLDVLAKQYAPVTEALLLLSGSVRHSATLLEVLVTVKLPYVTGFDSPSN